MLGQHVQVVDEQPGRAAFQGMQDGREFRGAATQAHLDHDPLEALAGGLRHRRAVGDRATAVAGAGLQDHGFQALHQAGGGQLDAGLGQEARTLGLLRHGRSQLLLDLRRLLQLHAHPQFAVAAVGDVLVHLQHRRGPPRMHQQQIDHGEHRQQQSQGQPAVAFSVCRRHWRLLRRMTLRGMALWKMVPRERRPPVRRPG